MSCFDVQILDPNINTIEVETCIGDQPSSIDIVTYDNISTVEINHCIALLPSEINDLIPVIDILAGSGIIVTENSGIYTISSSSGNSNIIDLLETVQDIIGNSGLLAGSFININYNDSTGYTTVSATGLQPSGNYSVDGHTHTSSNITDFNSSVSGLLPVKNINAGSGIGISSVSGDFIVSVTGTFGLTSEEVDDRISNLLVAGNYINLNYNDFGNSLTISVTGVQPSGNYSLVGHSHNTSDITNFDSGVSGLLPSVSGSGYIVSSFTNNIYTISVTGLQPSGNYSLVGHTHTSSDITNFNTAVSGLIPVKDIIAGTDINITSNSGIYTINSSNTIASDTLEPDGFVNRTDSIISFNDGSRQFSIAPKAPATTYAIYNNGVKVVKNTTETTTLPDTTALYFIHFDKSTNNLSYKTTGFNFDTDIPIAHIYYNADDNKAVYFGEERHGIRMDASTHRYLHNVFGTQYINGLSISNYSTSGNGSSNSDATIAIGDGLIYDEDIEANITHSNTPNDPFEQILNPIAQIPVYYKVGSNGAWTNTTANNYPLKTGTTVQYNLNSAGIWSTSDSTNPINNRYIAYWICATTQENAPIISIMGQRIDSSLEQATSNNAWGDLNLTGLPIVELRPLYRLIYDTKSTFSNTPKGFLSDVLDIRSHIDTVTGLTQNDHGNLYGLADDDHYQYVHIDNARTIDAIHTFTNGLNASGLINAASGNFTSLTVNSTGVSLVGHTHTSSDITDFNSSVSGLLPTISNSGDNRILTSDGTSTGINAESYLTFIYSSMLQRSSLSVSGALGASTNLMCGTNGFASNNINFYIDDFRGANISYNPPLSAATNWQNGLVFNTTSGNMLFYGKKSPNPFVTTPDLVITSGAIGINKFPATINYTLDVGGSGNFNSLYVSGIPVSISGHTHSSSDITDFNTSVSGLLPTIANSGDNRILTSDGTINGIIAESALTFDPNNQTLAGGPILKLFHEQTVDNISTAESSFLILSNYGRNTIGSAGRIQFEKSRGTQSSPLPLQNGDTLGVIRFYAPDNSGVLSNSARILLQSQGTASGVNNFVPTVMTLNTSSGPNQLDNSLILHSDGKLYSNGYLQIFQTNNRLDPSPNSGKNYGLGVYIATSGLSGSVDPNTPHTIYGIASNVSPRSPNNNHTMYYYGNIAGVYSELPSGVANSGAIYGSIAGAWRNSRGANEGDGWYDDNGTLSQLIGSVINYGHSIGQSGIGGPAPTGLTSYTANAYGLYIAPHKGYGTIDTAYDLLIADTNYNTGTINNHYGIYQIGNRSNYLGGSLTIDNGVSAPTPIFNLGSVSGNVSINYDINKQIQTLTLNGILTNFIEGSGWNISNKSVDVFLEMTVNSTTTVNWTIVDDQYNPFPVWTPGIYLILLRGMGSGKVQGHYIGKKTN